jgi:hypothetical protein
MACSISPDVYVSANIHVGRMSIVRRSLEQFPINLTKHRGRNYLVMEICGEGLKKVNGANMTRPVYLNNDYR